jgi:hypothetical protein
VQETFDRRRIGHARVEMATKIKREATNGQTMELSAFSTTKCGGHIIVVNKRKF